MSFTIDDNAWRKDLLDFVRKHMPLEIEKQLYKMADSLLTEIKGLTPVAKKAGGTLRAGWYISDVKRNGNDYYIEVYNNTEYAAHVEYGHEIKRGGKVLGRVKGRKMMTIPVEELRKNLSKEMETWLDEIVRLIAR